MTKKPTRQINVGGGAIGGGAPIVIQSMSTIDPANTAAALDQVRALATVGCALVRFAVPRNDSIAGLRTLCNASPLPIVADIHFDHRLAVAAAEAGVAKIRINPGNIGGRDRVREVAAVCKERGIPIRIGVNGGSLDPTLRAEHGLCGGMVESALQQAEMLQAFGFDDICVSLKASNVRDTIAACRLFAQKSDFPLHLGVTEAGTPAMGVIKSAVGIGSLLCDGIGDTIRVSLTAPPTEEVAAAKRILAACGLWAQGAEVVSCPTCGRCRVDLFWLADEVETALADFPKDKPIKVAVMGCAVNGPGEARDADCGVACGDGKGVLFCKGEIVRSVPECEIVPALLELCRNALHTGKPTI